MSKKTLLPFKYSKKTSIQIKEEYNNKRFLSHHSRVTNDSRKLMCLCLISTFFSELYLQWVLCPIFRLNVL